MKRAANAKRIVQVYKPPSQWKNQPPGVGDFLRGICNLYEILQGTGVDLYVDVSQTEFVDCIEQNTRFFCASPPDCIASAEELFRENKITLERIESFIHSDEKLFYLSTNLGDWDRVEMQPETRAFAKQFFVFNPGIESHIASSVPQAKYESLSIRCGDLFYRDTPEPMREDARLEILQLVETKILPEVRLPTIVTSDCYDLKLELVKRYGMFAFKHRSQHGAYGNVLPVALDLCMIKNSQRIFHINASSDWWSGFSHYTAMIHEIPSVNFRWPLYRKEVLSPEGLRIGDET